MKILLISYGDIGFDGRLRSLIHVFSQIGDVASFTRGEMPGNGLSKVSNSSYLLFIREAIRFAKEIGEFEWLVLDNRKATIPGMIIQRKYNPDITIQDSRELYLFRELHHLTGKIGCVFEKIMARQADIVICANKERAQIMQKEYSLRYEPLTYENLRQLQYDSDEELKKAEEKIKPYIHEDEYRIISTSGCNINRTNDILVRNLSKIKKKCRLFLVGDSTEEEAAKIKSIIEEEHLNNVEIFGKLNQTELKFLIKQCHIGIVNYGQYDTNNRLCASGKLYEFLYEGLPVVTTQNPPLTRLCHQYKIGYADDGYSVGINKVLLQYNIYEENVKKFILVHTTEANDSTLISNLIQRVSSIKHKE